MVSSLRRRKSCRVILQRDPPCSLLCDKNSHKRKTNRISIKRGELLLLRFPTSRFPACLRSEVCAVTFWPLTSDCPWEPRGSGSKQASSTDGWMSNRQSKTSAERFPNGWSPKCSADVRDIFRTVGRTDYLGRNTGEVSQ